MSQSYLTICLIVLEGHICQNIKDRENPPNIGITLSSNSVLVLSILQFIQTNRFSALFF